MGRRARGVQGPWGQKCAGTGAAGQEQLGGTGGRRGAFVTARCVSPFASASFSWRLSLLELILSTSHHLCTQFRRLSEPLGRSQEAWKHLVRGCGPRAHAVSLLLLLPLWTPGPQNSMGQLLSPQDTGEGSPREGMWLVQGH